MRSGLKHPIVILAALVLVAGACICGMLKIKAAEAEIRRKRNSDAFAIRDALLVYQTDHQGELPPSLADLGLSQSGVDVVPFKLLTLGVRHGKLDKDVLVEAEDAGKTKATIRIYRDGEVRWED